MLSQVKEKRGSYNSLNWYIIYSSHSSAIEEDIGNIKEVLKHIF